MMTVSPAVLLTYLYFLQGLPYGLQARFLPIYFRAHGMSLSNIGFIKVLFFPWMCKTLWAPLVDRHGNKKAWLSWSMFGLGVTCFLAARIEPSWYVYLCIILLLFNFLTSTQDIATDGLAIDILTSSQVASGNIAQVVGYKFGAIIGGGLLAWLSDHISWSSIFMFLCLIYATAIAVVKLCVPQTTSPFAEMTLNVPGSEHNPCTEKIPRQSEEGGVNNEVVSSVSQPAQNTRSKAKLSAADAIPLIHDTLKTSSRKDGMHPTNTKDDERFDENSGIMDQDSHSLNDSNAERMKRKDRGGKLGWIQDHFATVFKAEGTAWILFYVLIYKLGEQGALNMMPMFLMDVGVTAADVGLWTGVVGQAVSIVGSVLGGAAISSGRYTALSFLWLLSLMKVAVLASETVVICTWSVQSGSLGLGTVPGIALMLMLLLVSGAVSTSAFTLMMHCSQRASPHCRASHYSLLATAEVLGKLVFSVFVGAITDAVGYSMAFGLFLTLSVIVLPLFSYAPLSLAGGSVCTGNGANKNC